MDYGAGRSCLLVEDEVLVGMDLEEGLREAGFDVRWVASMQSALAVLQTASPDIAILDVIVRAEPSTFLASELTKRSIPFIVYSGYPRLEAVTEFQDVSWLEKPADIETIVSALSATLDAVADRVCATALERSEGRGWLKDGQVNPDTYAISRSYSSSAT